MADARVSVLLDIQSRLGGLDKALGGFKKLAGTVAGFAAAYLSTKAVVNGARDIIGLGAELNHLSAQTGIAESDLLTLRQAFSDNGVAIEQVGPSVNKMQRQMVQAARTGTGPVANANNGHPLLSDANNGHPLFRPAPSPPWLRSAAYPLPLHPSDD